MEINKTPSDDHLLDYLDGRLNEQDAKKLEDQIRTSATVQSRLEELRTVHTALSESAVLEVPSRNFTVEIMNRLDSIPALSGFSPRNGLLLLGGILVAVGIALMLLRAGTFDSIHQVIRLDTLPIPADKLRNSLPAIPFNGKMVVNVVLIIATGLSFVLLDRTILRPVFGKRSLKV